MKKYLTYFLVLLILCFFIPVAFTKKFKTVQTDIMQNAEDVIKPLSYDYKKYKTVKLYHAKTKKVDELALDEYLYGVVSAEMPASFEEEALKAQAVVARTYTLYKIILTEIITNVNINHTPYGIISSIVKSRFGFARPLYCL